MEPKLGLVFEHTRWLEEDRTPARFRVTRIAKGTVYYRDMDGAFLTHCPVEDFGKYARPITAT